MNTISGRVAVTGPTPTAARAAALRRATLTWPATGGAAETQAVDGLVAAGASRRPNGLLVPVDRIAQMSGALTARGLGPVTASRPDFVFETRCAPFDLLTARVKN